MAADLADLTRGAVCLALYPYTTGFPLDIVVRAEVEEEFAARLETHPDIESLEKTIHKGAAPEVVVSMKLRRVLLLQDGTLPGRQDVLVARINSVTEAKKARGAHWYRKLQNGIHPLFFMVGDKEEHGTNGVEAYVDTLNISPIRKATILRRTGYLDVDEMREVSERLVRSQELDISNLLRAAASS